MNIPAIYVVLERWGGGKKSGTLIFVQVVNVTIDNLLKGAATQAQQNMNLALGYAEFEGIPLKEKGSGGMASF